MSFTLGTKLAACRADVSKADAITYHRKPR